LLSFSVLEKKKKQKDLPQRDRVALKYGELKVERKDITEIGTGRDTEGTEEERKG
jgi:hypothetical protein